MKVFITGGEGNLGKCLVKNFPKNYELRYPTKDECDILNSGDIFYELDAFKPDIIIHLAAFVDTLGCESNKIKAIDMNVLGTINLVKASSHLNCKFVYVSSEYVFKGDKGNYTINDRLNPTNVYGKTKASAEYITSILDNYQIIRAPFIKKQYDKVFTNQFCSRYFLEDVIDKIIDNIINNDSPIVHIANEKKSLYDLYISKGLNPEPIKIPKEMEKLIPKDTSLINNSI